MRLSRAGGLVLALTLACVGPKAAAAGPRSADGTHGAETLPRPHVMQRALTAWACARARDEIRKPVLAVIDYSLPSTERRLWIFDMEAGRVLHHELVTHGRGSGELFAERFSNLEGSHQTSLGLFVTRAPYRGKHGLSLRMTGLEPGINDRAYERAIVIHGAFYATAAHAERWGRLGRSHGCPALDPAVTPAVIERLRDGAAVFAYADEPDWLESSRYLACGEPAPTLRLAAASTAGADAAR